MEFLKIEFSRQKFKQHFYDFDTLYFIEQTLMTI